MFSASQCIPSVPVRTLEELIVYAKANPGKLSYGHRGCRLDPASDRRVIQIARGNHPSSLTCPMRHRPIGHRPDRWSGSDGHTKRDRRRCLNFIGPGKLRILAVTSPTRLVAAPELPTGRTRFPVMTARGSIGLLAPAGTPVGTIETLNARRRARRSPNGLPADADRRGYRTRSRLRPRNIGPLR